MLLELAARSPLIEPVTPELLDSLADAETVLETLARMDGEGGEAFKLRLKEEHLLLYRAGQEENGPVAALRLGLAIRF